MLSCFNLWCFYGVLYITYLFLQIYDNTETHSSVLSKRYGGTFFWSFFHLIYILNIRQLYNVTTLRNNVFFKSLYFFFLSWDRQPTFSGQFSKNSKMFQNKLFWLLIAANCMGFFLAQKLFDIQSNLNANLTKIYDAINTFHHK